jgi:excisionase family DNA binding protein
MDKTVVQKLITPQELIELLGLKRSCIYRLLNTGELPSIRVTKGVRKSSLRVRPSDLERWLTARQVGR